MIKKTIGQVIYQLRNQPLLSAITILGTALAIALIMVILIVYQAKTADYAPEVNVHARFTSNGSVRYMTRKNLTAQVIPDLHCGWLKKSFIR